MKKEFSLLKNLTLKGLLAGVSILMLSSNAFSQSAMFGVTPDHSGIYNSTFPTDLVLTKKWSVKTQGRIFSTASVLNNVVYFGSDDSCLYAIESSGNLKWKFKSNGRIRSTPAIKDTVVYFNNYGGTFYALDSRTGVEIWNYSIEKDVVRSAKGVNGSTPHDKLLVDPWDVFQSSPVYLDTIVYFGSEKTLYALNMKNGRQVWNFSAPKEIHSTPAIHKGMLYFGCWDSKLYALDAFTGVKKWDFQAGMDTVSNYMAGIQSSPSVVDSFVFIGSRDAKVYALHATTGKMFWKTDFGGSWMPSSFVMLNDTLYTGSSDAAGFFALNKLTGKVNYSVKLPCFAFSSPIYSNGTVFIGSTNGSLFCIDPISKKIRSRFDTDGHIKDILNALNDDGSLNEKAFPPNSSDYETSVRWTEVLFSTGSLFTTPVIENSVVYFGSTDSCFYAVQDNGGCKTKFSLTNNSLDLGEVSGTSIDTAIYITISSDCIDTILVKKTFAKTLSDAIILEPSMIILDGKKSTKIKVNVNLSLLKNQTYKGQLIFSTKSNEYNSEAINFSLKPIATSIQSKNNQNTGAAYPNPFVNFATIEYAILKAGKVDVDIYNSYGQSIRKLFSGNQENGNHQLIWNGANNMGSSVLPGIYFCTIKLENNLSTIKLIKEK